MRTHRKRLTGRFIGIRPLVIAAALVFAATSTARAQKGPCPKGDAKCLYKRGTQKYVLGEYDAAIKLYREGYELSGDPAFLFNIAQSHRQKGDCRNAIFFYKRFLLVNPKAPNRKEVEARIEDLEENCRQQEAIAEKPPQGDIPPRDDGDTADGSDTGDTGDTDAGDEGTGEDPDTDVAMTTDDDGFDDGFDDTEGDLGVRKPLDQPEMFVSEALVGPAFLGFGNLEVPAQFSLAVGGGYPIPAGPALLDAGGMITYTPVPWDSGSASGTASLVSLLANAGATYPLHDKISLRGELGLGVLLFGGLSQGNVFTNDGAAASGALSMLNVRFAAAGTYELMPNLTVTAAPLIYSYSPAKEGLRDDLGSLTRFEMMIGVGYRM